MRAQVGNLANNIIQLVFYLVVNLKCPWETRETPTMVIVLIETPREPQEGLDNMLCLEKLSPRKVQEGQVGDNHC